MEKTRVPTSEEIVSTLSSLLDEMKGISIVGAKLSRMPDGSLGATKNMSSVLSSLSADSLRSSLLEVIRGACKRADRVGPGSTEMTVSFLAKLVSAMHDEVSMGKSSASVLVDVDTSIKEVLSLVSACSIGATVESLDRVSRNVIQDAELSSMVIEAIKLSGSECKIFVEPTPAMVSTVERVEGHHFMVRPDHTFFRSNRWSAEGVKLFILDGMIENVSEIDAILGRCHLEKQPMVIFARGFNPDVITTLRTNWARGTLNVLPVEVIYDLDSANILKDIAVVSGTDVVSSLKGQLISSVKLDDLPTVKHVVCSGYTAIISSDNRDGVLAHLKALQQKRNIESFDEVVRALDRRIRSLSSASVMVKVSAQTGPESIDKLQRLDSGLRMAKGMMTHGHVSSSVLREALEKANIGHAMRIALKETFKEEWELPTLMVAACVRFGASAAISLASIGSAVVIDSL